MLTYAVIVCAGKGTRFAAASNRSTLKQYIEIGATPIWVRAARSFDLSSVVDGVVIVCPKNDVLNIQSQLEKFSFEKVVSVVAGGEMRQDSVFNGLEWIKNNIKRCDYVFVHDGVRPFISAGLIFNLWKSREHGAVIPVIPILDTVKEVHQGTIKKTLDRSKLKRAQTPQLFKFDLILQAFEWLKKSSNEVTDEANILELMGHAVKTIEGDADNIKVTLPRDLKQEPQVFPFEKSPKIQTSKPPSIHVGQGIDVHAFCEGNKIILGGIEVPYHQSLKGHSDADVLTHAICDGLLGAAGMSDIGTYFPDTDAKYRGISSFVLLEKVMDKVASAGYKISHIDVTVLAEKPKLSGYIPEMKLRVASKMKLKNYQLAIKATTTERLGFIGRSEGIAAQAIVTLERRSR